MEFALLKDVTGLRILGGYDEFRRAHELLHDINDRSPIVLDKEGLFLGLAYDLRKAFEGQRYIARAPTDAPGATTAVGFEILWPTLLIQTRMVRVALGFMDHTKRHQILAYSLEAIIEEALPHDFPKLHASIQHAYLRLDPQHPHLETKAPSRIEYWYRWNKADRKARVLELLGSLDPSFDQVYRFKKGQMSPKEWDSIESDRESPHWH